MNGCCSIGKVWSINQKTNGFSYTCLMSCYDNYGSVTSTKDEFITLGSECIDVATAQEVITIKTADDMPFIEIFHLWNNDDKGNLKSLPYCMHELEISSNHSQDRLIKTLLF